MMCKCQKARSSGPPSIYKRGIVPAWLWRCVLRELGEVKVGEEQHDGISGSRQLLAQRLGGYTATCPLSESAHDICHAVIYL